MLDNKEKRGSYYNGKLQNNNRDSPLHLAVRSGHSKIIDLILDHISTLEKFIASEWFNINATKNNPFQEALNGGNIEIVVTMLKKTRRLIDNSYFLLEASKGDLAMIKIFLDAGYSVHEQDELGYTPLHKAAYSGQTAAASFLLSKGALVKMLTKDSQSALHLAAKKIYTKTCLALLHDTILQIIETNPGSPDLRSWLEALRGQGVKIGEEKEEILHFIGTYFLPTIRRLYEIKTKINNQAYDFVAANITCQVNPARDPIPLKLLLNPDLLHIYFPLLIEKWFGHKLEAQEDVQEEH